MQPPHEHITLYVSNTSNVINESDTEDVVNAIYVDGPYQTLQRRALDYFKSRLNGIPKSAWTRMSLVAVRFKQAAFVGEHGNNV